MNRALLRLLVDRDAALRARNIDWRITGVASRRLGWIADASGLDLSLLGRARDRLAANQFPSAASRGADVREWLHMAKADVVFEATPLKVEDGQPAIDHLRAALEHGAHAITANKGPIVHAFDELRQLAAQQGQRFLFESTVMDGVPIFSLFRENLPAIHLKSFRGILNSTTNVILACLEEGLTFEAALKRAQEIGVAETDARHDVDGWDAAVKVAALVIVLMGEKIQLKDIERQGIRQLTGEQVRDARARGTPYKLVCSAKRAERGIVARVAPESLPWSDPLAGVAGTSSIVYFETDIFPGLCIREDNPGLYATAYGMLADFIRAVGGA